ncbi:MAG: alcohol dehydrogenase catalytic domain-containing protein [Spirochaetales bacterium]|nr:alcohol dehydrogenase catalytic domain-containing protein [Spirochaetales bacterium]
MLTKTCVVNAEKNGRMNGGDRRPNRMYQNPKLHIAEMSLEKLDPLSLRVKMLYFGICGTDVHLMKVDSQGYIVCSAPIDIPEKGLILGHEGVGVVLEVGSYVKNFKPGMFVAFESILTCNYCRSCRSGNFNQCTNAKLVGLEMNGIFGEIVDVSASLAHDVSAIAADSRLNIQAAACIEPASVAYVACENAKIKGGDKVVVLGAGPIGLFSAMLAKDIFGASSVNVVEPVEFRRTKAGRFCDSVHDVGEFFDDPPDNIDVIIEASGDLDCVNRIFHKLNPNGRIALLARLGVPLRIDNVDHLITNAITIVGSRGHLGGAFHKVIDLYKHKKIDLCSVVTTVDQGIDKLIYYLRENQDKIIRENCKVLIRV